MLQVQVRFLSLLVITCSLPIKGQIDFPTTTNKGQLILAETATNIIHKFFTDSPTILIIERSFHVELRDFNRLVMEYVMQNLNESISVQLFCGKSEHKPWENHVFIVDSEEAFLETAWNLPGNDFDVEFRFLVILTHFGNEMISFRALENIFTACREYNVLNVDVLLNDDILGVSLYTYTLFTKTKCHTVQPYLLYQLNNGLDNVSNIFPQKLLDIHGCPLRVCAQQNPPVLSFSGNRSHPKSVNNWSNLRGIDGHLIKLLAESLNFTIDLLPIPAGNTIYLDNDTALATGCFEKLLTKGAEIAIGGFSGSDPNRRAITPSILYYQTPIVFVIRAKKELDCVNRLGRPFSDPVWFCVIALLLAGAFSIQVLRTLKDSYLELIIGERNYTPSLNFLAVFLGYPVTRTPRGLSARYILTLWLLMTLVLRNAYQASLYDSIRIDRFERIPRKYDELYASNYKVFITKFYQSTEAFNPNQTIVIKKNHYERLKYLQMTEGKFATIALQDHIISYLEQHFRTGSDLRIVQEQVYQFRMAMYFEKHSIYATTINDCLNQFVYAGLIRKLVRKSAKDRRLFRSDKTELPLEAITNGRLYSLYQNYWRLIGLSVAAFVLEFLSKYSRKLRKMLDWFH